MDHSAIEGRPQGDSYELFRLLFQAFLDLRGVREEPQPSVTGRGRQDAPARILAAARIALRSRGGAPYRLERSRRGQPAPCGRHTQHASRSLLARSPPANRRGSRPWGLRCRGRDPDGDDWSIRREATGAGACCQGRGRLRRLLCPEGRDRRRAGARVVPGDHRRRQGHRDAAGGLRGAT